MERSPRGDKTVGKEKHFGYKCSTCGAFWRKIVVFGRTDTWKKIT